MICFPNKVETYAEMLTIVGFERITGRSVVHIFLSNYWVIGIICTDDK